MDTTKTEQEWREYLADLVNEGASETLTLEFKSGHALNKVTPQNRDEIHEEITRDVTALANAEGGMLIYGIQEKSVGKNRVADGVQPVEEARFSKHTLEQVINRILPKIPGVRVERVTLGTTEVGCCYVVVVPQGVSAHQALDGRFHSRRGTEVLAMSHQEILDVLNRREDPDLRVSLKLVVPDAWGTQNVTSSLFIRLENVSSVMARHWFVEINFPSHLGSCVAMPADAPETPFIGVGHVQLTNVDRSPLFPGQTIHRRISFFALPGFAGGEGPLNQALHPQLKRMVAFSPSLKMEAIVRVFADNMRGALFDLDLSKAKAAWVEATGNRP
jgi:hypothetical protein